MATKIQKNQIATTLIDGWTPADATWTYASASTITVPSGAASIYQKGDRIKWTQTTVKYGVIIAVADTLLTIAANTDYTVANAAISANYYSHQANPLGYPTTFNFTPGNIDWNGTDPTTPTTTGRFSIMGNMFQFFVKQTNTGAGSGNTRFQFSLPVNNALGTSGKVNAPILAYFSTSSDSGVQMTTSSLAGVYSTAAGTYILCDSASIAAYHVWVSGTVIF